MGPPQENRRGDHGHNLPIQSPYLHPPPQLPPETYAYLIHALLSLQGSAYVPTATYPSLANSNFPWSLDAVHPASSVSIAGPSSFYPTNPPITSPLSVPQDTTSTQLALSAAASPSTAEDPEGSGEVIPISEDKRRRNTAASARFRVKKKLKTLNLERTVTDLVARADELEREANDLRRENTWLKEIVLLRGRNLAALNPGSQGSAPDHRHEQQETDHRTPVELETESAADRRGKENDKDG